MLRIMPRARYATASRIDAAKAETFDYYRLKIMLG